MLDLGLITAITKLPYLGSYVVLYVRLIPSTNFAKRKHISNLNKVAKCCHCYHCRIRTNAETVSNIGCISLHLATSFDLTKFVEARDAEDCGFQTLNDDEIVTSVQEESDPVDYVMDEDGDNNNDESNKGPSNADAFSVLETAMEWYKQQSECCPLNFCCSR
ncbi:uncharacterized protein TNCV_2868021 [Trichonephila clavipes]|nr:uncharacterized protein TNCV_2868021 [Trichonephila clavipes]